MVEHTLSSFKLARLNIRIINENCTVRLTNDVNARLK